MSPRAPLKTDLLVVGLGPGGGAAASAAAARGLEVIAVERKKTLGAPVQCAEFIPLPLSPHAQGDGVLVQRITNMKSVLPSGKAHITDFPGLMIDRAAFDAALARKAEAAGARLCLESRLTALDIAARTAQIDTPEGRLDIEYRLLVAADGAHSRVAALTGLPPLATVNTRQYTVALLGAPYAATDIWLSPAYPGGYAWLFPKGAFANLGLGADKRFTADLKAPLDALHRQLVEEGRVGADILHHTGGALPVGGMRERLRCDNILFVGDAAGFTHPITGGGIAAAVMSGTMAGEAAAAFLMEGDGEALDDYDTELRDQFAGTLGRAVARRRMLDRYWNSEAAREDALHRQGWIAFPDYFAPDDFKADAAVG
ncbi:MAG: geranylgeranyl reductase family protein [Pseudomonadota bacterium]